MCGLLPILTGVDGPGTSRDSVTLDIKVEYKSRVETRRLTITVSTQ